MSQQEIKEVAEIKNNSLAIPFEVSGSFMKKIYFHVLMRKISKEIAAEKIHSRQKEI